MGSWREKKGKAPSAYPSLTARPLDWIHPGEYTDRKFSLCYSIQHTSVRGFLGTDFAREWDSQNHLQQLCQSWELTASIGVFLILRYPLAAAAAAAKSLQSCLTLCDPIDGTPPGSPVPGILQARTLEWVAISFSNAWKWKGKAPKAWNTAMCSNMNGLKIYSTEWSESDRERQISHNTTYTWSLKSNTNESIYKIETDSQT